MSKSCDLKASQKLFLLHLDQATSCCRAHPVSLSTYKSVADLNQLWDDENEALTRGTELPGCQHCWNHEHQGIPSYRQQLSTGVKRNNTIELFIDNTCNQMCSYCSPKFSSSWEKSIAEHGNFQRVSSSSRRNLEIVAARPAHSNWLKKIHDYINSCNDSSVDLKLLGGEPLMQKRNLENLLQANQTKIRRLCITTNLNPPNSKFLQWVLEVFPTDKLVFEVSLDTVPEHNAMPRAGFDIVKFEQNLNLLKQRSVNFYFFSVVSILNIFTLSQYRQWLDRNNYTASFFRINNPDCLDIVYLPEEFKKTLLSYNMPTIVTDALHNVHGSVDLKQFEQYNYLKQYFERTNTKITDPDFSTYWDWLERKFK